MMKRRIANFALALLTLAATILPTISIYALDYDTLKFFADNNIIYYDPTARGCLSGGIPSGSKITLIGDSLSVGAQSKISAKFTGIDFQDKTYYGKTYQLIQVSKHFSMDSGENYSGTTIAQQLKDQGELRPYLIFALGTNDPGAVTESSIDNLVSIVGESTNIILVTNASDGSSGAPNYEANNAAMRESAKNHKNIVVADWAKAIAGKETQYINDNSLHVHLNDAGNELFAETIYQAMSAFGGTTYGNSSGSNTNYAGEQVFSDAEIQAIAANQSVYEAAASKYGFSWPLLAVVHYLETSLSRSNPSNGQGLYQLYSYTAGGTNSNAFLPAGPVSDAEFARQTELAAADIAAKAAHLNLNNDDDVKRLFFQYNGTAQVYKDKAIALGFSAQQAENGEGSPYVMNRFDAQRDPTSSSMHSAWPGRFVADGVYDSSSTSNRFGAFVLYTALGGSTNSYCNTNNSDVVQVALNLSWEGTRIHSKNDPKPEYVEAMKAVNTYRKGCHGDGTCAPEGASCDQFVSTVMRFSGSDTEFPAFSGGSGPGSQIYHLENSGKYDEINHNNDYNNLQPGDIFVTVNNGYHIYLYLGEIEGQQYQASASWNDRTGEHFAAVYFQDSYGKSGGSRYYRVFRRNNNQ